MKALFLVNGLGLGNSTRCHAIVQALAAQGVEVAVMTSGNGLWYFEGRDEVVAVHPMESFYYASEDGKISITGTLMAAGHFLGIAMRNERRIAAVVDAWHPDVVVIDSTYTVWSVKRRGVPLVALNNADVVHVSYHRFADRPDSVRAQFHAIEENDFRFHRLVCDRVVSPSLDPRLPEVGLPFVRTGPIVREGYDPAPTDGPVKQVVIMLSGSVFGTPVELSQAIPGIHVDVIGRDGPEDGSEHDGVTYHGKLRDNRELLATCDLAVVNGGFSAVSEIFSMRKPMVVIPVPNHAEQWINARTVQELGVGTVGTEETLERDLLDALDRIEALRAGYARLPDAEVGAQQAAEAILDVARGQVRQLEG